MFTHPTWGCQVELYGVSDTITFNFSEGQHAAYASVEAQPPWLSPKQGYVKFIGDEGAWQTSLSDQGTYFFEISSAEIGEIESVVLDCNQGAFTTVRIGVIPEPGTAISILNDCGNRGTVYDDRFDAPPHVDYQPLAGVHLFIDVNDSGVFDGDDPWTISNGNGDYSFQGLEPGRYPAEYTVYESVPEG